MFKQRTTIVVGAGASHEIGLPIGSKLQDDIIEILRLCEDGQQIFADDRLNDCIEQAIPNDRTAREVRGFFRDAAIQMRDGLPYAESIDNYLYTHQDDKYVKLLGKTAIAILILEAERTSDFFPKIFDIANIEGQHSHNQPSIDNFELNKSWHKPFARLVMSGVRANNPVEAFRNLSFVIFNYDRCVEEYLYEAIQKYYFVDGPTAAQSLSEVAFIHPYGSLGPLPWQVKAPASAVHLGARGINKSRDAATRIKTFTESCDADTDEQVKSAISSAEAIILLGFGYNPQNVELLRPPGTRRARRVFTTSVGIDHLSYEDLREVMTSMARHDRNMRLYLEDRGCRELFGTFQLPLTR